MWLNTCLLADLGGLVWRVMMIIDALDLPTSLPVFILHLLGSLYLPKDKITTVPLSTPPSPSWIDNRYHPHFQQSPTPSLGSPTRIPHTSHRPYRYLSSSSIRQATVQLTPTYTYITSSPARSESVFHFSLLVLLIFFIGPVQLFLL